MREPWVRTLWVVWLAELIAIMGMSLVIPFLPLYLVHDLGVTEKSARLWAGVIGGANFLCGALVAPLWGSLADRRGRKPMAIRALFGLAVAVGLMALARNPWQLLMLRLLQGALGGFVAAAVALVGTAVPREKVGTALGFLQTSMVTGNLVGPLLGGVLSDRYGVRFTFWITGAALLVAAALVIFLVQEKRQVDPEAHRAGYLQNFRMLAGMPRLRVLFGVIFLTQAGIMMINPQFALFVRDLAGRSRDLNTLVGALTAAPAVSGFLMAPFWGRQGDRRGHARMLGTALLGSGVIYPWGALAGSVWQLVLLRLGLGGFTCAVSPSAHSVVAHSVEEHRTASAFSLLASAQMLGSAAGPFVGGPLAAHFGIRSLFPITAALLLAASCGAWSLGRAPDAGL